MTVFDPVKLCEAHRRAYPLGCLPMRGVTTFGGFTCIGEVREEGPSFGWHFVKLACSGTCARCIVKPNDPPERIRGLAGMVGESDDDLLPALTDPATFYLALMDLVRARCNPGLLIGGCSWRRNEDGSPRDSWTLTVWPIDGTEMDSFFMEDFKSIYTDDPMMAFLLVRAQVREETGR